MLVAPLSFPTRRICEPPSGVIVAAAEAPRVLLNGIRDRRDREPVEGHAAGGGHVHDMLVLGLLTCGPEVLDRRPAVAGEARQIRPAPDTPQDHRSTDPAMDLGLFNQH
jgi:hypothetical protein